MTALIAVISIAALVLGCAVGMFAATVTADVHRNNAADARHTVNTWMPPPPPTIPCGHCVRELPPSRPGTIWHRCPCGWGWRP